MTSNSSKEKLSPLHIALTIAIPIGLAVPAWLGLSTGATVVVSCERISEKVMEVAMENRGPVTVPVTRVVREGRVDVTVQEKILGLVAWKEHKLADVTEASSSKITTVTRDAQNRRTGSHDSMHLRLKMRDGSEWESPEAAYAFGDLPKEMEEAIKAFIDKGGASSLRLWWASWLPNLIGLPFAVLFLLFALGIIMSAARKILGIKPAEKGTTA